MATIRSLRVNESLDSHWTDLVYTESLLLRHPKTKGLAPPLSEQIKLVEEKMQGQHDVWRAGVAAQSRVDIANETLRSEVRNFSEDLKSAIRKQGVLRPEEAPRFTRYFKTPPNRVIRMGLESQVRYLRAWTDSLQGEPEAELQQYADRFKSLLIEGDEAIRERVRAQASTVDHRLREIRAFVDEANHVRGTIYAELLRREHAERLTAGWAGSFFRKSAISAGENRDLCRGKAQAVLGFLATRSIAITEEQQKTILEETNPEVLELYIQRAVSVTSIDALLEA